MLIDMHIHTNRYSPCSSIDPLGMIYKALELRLSGIAIVEHYNLWSREEIEELKGQTKAKDLLILRGQEISCPIGHLLLFGYSGKLKEDIPFDEILPEVHNCSGIIILSHPFRNGLNIGHNNFGVDKALSHLDGVEIFSSNHTENANDYAEKIWNDLQIPGVGGSDAHCIEKIGSYLTQFQNDFVSEDDLIPEIKAGRCKPIRNAPQILGNI